MYLMLFHCFGIAALRNSGLIPVRVGVMVRVKARKRVTT
jgi:hypothetical protein